MACEPAHFNQPGIAQRLSHLADLLSQHPGMLTCEAADTYARAGLKIFPLWWVRGRPALPGKICACPKGATCDSPGKHPRIKNGFLMATADLQQVSRWWAMWPNANIGLPMEMNGLAGLDIDPAHGGEPSLANLLLKAEEMTGEFPDFTLLARTATGGYHYYYTAPHNTVKNSAGTFGPEYPGLDTRSKGYLVAPPSRGLNGRYEFVRDCPPIAPWPQALTDLIREADEARKPAMPTGPYEPPSAARGDWGGAALRGECLDVAGAAVGKRNDRLNAAAFKIGRIVGGGYLKLDQAAPALLAAAQAAGLSEDEAGRTIASGLRAGMARPRHPAPAQPLP